MLCGISPVSSHRHGEKVALDCEITSHERQPGGVPGTPSRLRAADRSGQSLMPGCQHRGERRDVLDLPLHDRLPMFPFGATSFSGTILLVSGYTLEGITDKVKRPALIAASEGEAHWHDQSGKVCDAIPSARTRDIGGVHERRGFRRAGQHCEAKALGHRSRRIFDWPDETLDPSRNQPPTSDAHASRRSRHLNTTSHANALAIPGGASAWTWNGAETNFVRFPGSLVPTSDSLWQAKVVGARRDWHARRRARTSAVPPRRADVPRTGFRPAGHRP